MSTIPENSILNTTKKLLGIDSSYTEFDVDVITHINTVFSILAQLGVGPGEGFSISGYDETWDEFLNTNSTASTLLNDVQTYMYLKVRQYFDPPTSSSVLSSNERLIAELEWRINASVDYR